MKVIAYNHTHWDREWYEPFETFRLRFAQVIELILGEIAKENIECFYLDGQTIILEDYFEIYPDKKAIIKELITKGKIIIGPWYVLADEFLVSGESLFRNMLIGINQSKELGCKKFIGYLPDSFGHNSEIPRILNAFGISHSVLWRGAGTLNSEFIWKSHDDSSVLATYLIEGYFQNIIHENIPIEQKAEKLQNFLDNIKKYSSSDYILLPIGGDHLGPVIDLKNQINDINLLLKEYNFENGNIFDYAEKFCDEKILKSPLQHLKGELRDNTRNPILPGTLSSRIYLKQLNAISSWKLNKLAEPFYTFLQKTNMVSSATNEINHAWKTLIKNHPHDSICGCSINHVHDEMIPRFSQVNQISDRLILRGQNAVSSKINKDAIWIYNASDYEYTGTVKIKTKESLPENIKKQFVKSTVEFPKEILLDTQRPPFSEDMTEYSEYLVFAENIPAHSIKIIDKNFLYNEKIHDVQIGENFIQNSRIRIDINPDNTLSLTDFELGRKYAGLHYFYDRQDTGDTYNYAPLEADTPFLSKLIKTEIMENGKLRSTLRLVNNIKNTLITTDVSLSAGSKRAEFSTRWENTEENHILQVKFKLKEAITETHAENTFGIIKREHKKDYSLKKLIPCNKGTEAKTNTAPMQRFVYAAGLGIITEGLSEYGVDNDELFITLLRAVGKLSKLSLNTRNFPAGPPLDTSGAQCIGSQEVKYAICAVQNSSELFKQSDEFFSCTIADAGSNQSLENPNNFEGILQFLKINNKNIYTYAVKSAENTNNSGLIARFMNMSEHEQSVNFESKYFSSYLETNGQEENISKSANLEEVVIFKPYQLKTIYFT